MSFQFSSSLCCPLDGLPLRQCDGRLLCENRHSFDIARQGYVNLLGAKDKRSLNPGDSKAMISARRNFLDSGHYRPIADKLVDLLQPVLSSNALVADAGCGEGYYLQQLQSQLETRAGYSPAIIGFDISKWAVQAASRRFAASWLVASNRNIPIANESTDCLLSLFGFPVLKSFRQVMKENGSLLTVTAGPRHLIELREIIYPAIKKFNSSLVQYAEEADFKAGESYSLEFTTAPLKQLEIQQLLTMTPHLFRASQAGKEKTTLLDKFQVTVDVSFQFLHKK